MNQNPDITLIGAGIMSATLAILFKELDPHIKINIYERLPVIAGESSDAWNNAGTGHAALCELNYTPRNGQGAIDCSKAISIHEQFEISRQLWAYLVEKNILINPEHFIRSVPHMSFVWGEEDVKYLKDRFEALSSLYPFSTMQFTQDHSLLNEWIPLVMEHRNADEPLAATRMECGTDVNFGALTRSLLSYLDTLEGVEIYLQHEVKTLDRNEDGGDWTLEIKNLETRNEFELQTPFVFIGAGGGSLHLLEKSGIPEGNGFGGFPVSGQWFKCKNESLIKKHFAKVYGKAKVGAPPMSVPHLDTRIIDGKQELLFGPYAGFSSKFLKEGSYLDLATSINFTNIVPMLSAGWDNIPLTKYLLHEVTQSDEERLTSLQEFIPNAKLEDWEIVIAGQRVQVIKKDDVQGGVLEFGTEIVSSKDGSLAALLGASPGASTAASIMIKLLSTCFSDQLNTEHWQKKIKEIIPSFGLKISDDNNLCDRIRERTDRLLKLNSK